MYIKKTEKEGFILVETMIIVAVCILILNMYIKGTIWDIEKSSLYTINNDLLYMDESELEFIDVVKEEINKNQELKDKIKNDELIKELEYRYTNDDFSFNITFFPLLIPLESWLIVDTISLLLLKKIFLIL